LLIPSEQECPCLIELLPVTAKPSSSWITPKIQQWGIELGEGQEGRIKV